MKKIIFILFLLVTLTSCWMTNQEIVDERDFCFDNWYESRIYTNSSSIAFKVSCTDKIVNKKD